MSTQKYPRTHLHLSCVAPQDSTTSPEPCVKGAHVGIHVFGRLVRSMPKFINLEVNFSPNLLTKKKLKKEKIQNFHHN